MNFFSKKVTSTINDVELLSFQERIERSNALKQKYPHCVPVIVKKNKNDVILQDQIQSKYLIPKNVEISYLLISIKKKLKLDANKALFVFVQKNNENSFLVTPSMNMGEVYNSYSSSDGFVYLIYTSENTFG
jgi:GABA(A) receptor-associated protein